MLCTYAYVGNPSCSDEDQEFAIRHGLEFVNVYDADRRHIVNSDKVSHDTFMCSVIG